MISHTGYGFEHVNVVAQRRDHESLLNVVERLIRTRKECPELGQGAWHLIQTDEPGVLAHCCQWRGGTVMALHNFTSEPRVVKLDLTDFEATHMVDLVDENEANVGEDGSYEVRMPGYGWFWYRLGGTRR